MNIVDDIPVKPSTMKLVPKDRPVVETVNTKAKTIRTVDYPQTKLYIPTQLHSSFYRLCNISPNERKTLSDFDLEGRILTANQQKDIFIRSAGEKPLSAVSGKFIELEITSIAKELEQITQTSPIIRYFNSNERVQLIFPISNAFHQLYLFMDSGDYGVYGGSGKSAASYGLAWNNGEFASMTMFLFDELVKTQGRMIHLKGKTLPDRISKVLATAEKIEKSTQESKKKYYSKDEVIEYATYYQPELTERITKPLISGLRDEISSYDLSCRLTRLVTPLTKDHVRLRVEYMAGELIICYEDIKKDLANKASATQDLYIDRLKMFGMLKN